MGPGEIAAQDGLIVGMRGGYSEPSAISSLHWTGEIVSGTGDDPELVENVLLAGLDATHMDPGLSDANDRARPG